MTITRVGTNQKYAEGWATAFGRKKSGAAAAKPAARPAKKAASPKKKASGKRKK